MLANLKTTNQLTIDVCCLVFSYLHVIAFPFATHQHFINISGVHGFLSFLLRWLKTVSSSWILIGRFSHSLSLDAAIVVSRGCPVVGGRVVVVLVTLGVAVAALWPAETALNYSFGGL